MSAMGGKRTRLTADKSGSGESVNPVSVVNQSLYRPVG